jgi:hypothetical protein
MPTFIKHNRECPSWQVLQNAHVGSVDEVSLSRREIDIADISCVPNQEICLQLRPHRNAESVA